MRKGLYSHIGIIFSSLFFICLFFLLTETTHAQSLLDLPGSNPVQVSVSPEYPRPGQQVTITLSSYTADLERSNIQWFINGVKAKEGIAQKQFSVTAGASGSTQEVDVIITAVNGVTLTKNIVIQPGDVEILWQAESYTPPFYKGKALYPLQADLVAVAVPHLVRNGVTLKPEDLVYSWKKNGSVLKNESGYGKNIVTIPGGFGSKTIDLTVTVSSRDNRSTGMGRVVINNTVPQVVLYEDSLLYGTIYSKALASSFELGSQEIRLRAAPYFFSSSAHHTVSPLSFRWAINGLAIGQTSDVITLRKPEKTGVSLISVDTENPTKMFQKSSKNMTVNFNNE